jgi:hypothetical protein
MTKKLKLLIASTAIAVGGLSGFAFAKGHMGHRKEMVEKFDANKDGKLDDAEKSQLRAAFAQKKAEKLAKFDSNKDGKLDDAERTAMHDERVAERFAKLDLNKDGSITLAEMKAAKPQGRHGRGGHRGHRMSK